MTRFVTHGSLCLYCGRVGRHFDWCYRSGTVATSTDGAGRIHRLVLHPMYHEDLPNRLPNVMVHPYQNPDAPFTAPPAEVVNGLRALVRKL